MKSGYVFAPYILVSRNAVIVEGNMASKKKINSKYVQTVASRFGSWMPLNERRSRKIKKILQKLEDLKDQSKSSSSI